MLRSSGFSRLNSLTAIREYGILAATAHTLSTAELQEIRTQPDTKLPIPIPPNFFKHAEDQSIAGLFAVSHAIHELDSAPQDFSDWGIVGSSQCLGQHTLLKTLNKYNAEGPWGVSVQVVPNASPHALSSTIGLALKIHGPAMGCAGNQRGVTEALMNAAALISSRSLRGVWIVMSMPLYDTSASDLQPWTGCQVISLALAANTLPHSRGILRFCTELPPPPSAIPIESEWNLLWKWITESFDPRSTISIPLCHGTTAELIAQPVQTPSVRFLATAKRHPVPLSDSLTVSSQPSHVESQS